MNSIALHELKRDLLGNLRKGGEIIEDLETSIKESGTDWEDVYFLADRLAVAAATVRSIAHRKMLEASL